MTPLLLLALGCSGGPVDSGPDAVNSTTLSVDCLGMIRDADGPFGEAARSRTWAYNETTQSRESRCFFQWPDGVEGSTELPAMRGNELQVAVSSGSPFANMSFTYGEALYNTTGGTVTFDSFEDGRASGSYRVTAETLGVPAFPGVLPAATIEGRFDWCDVQRTDCPHKSAIDGLDKAYAAEAPATDPSEGQTVYCRILHDEALQAVRVDLQFASWNGINTAELFVDACSPGGGAEPQGNAFLLQATNISGPGQYTLGRQRRVYAPDATSGELTNDFSWAIPAVLEADIPSYQICTSYLNQSRVVRSDDPTASCTLDLETDRFAVTCDTAEQTGLGQFGQDSVEGPFHLESDCEWVTR